VLRIDATEGSPTAAQLGQLLAACPSLTELDLQFTVLNDQGLEAVLTHGPDITSLTLGSIRAEHSFADKVCKWERLCVTGKVDYSHVQPSVLLLAGLPLRTVTDLVFWGARGLSDLQLPLSRVPAAQLPVILRQAATNLASCPAWQAGSKGRVSLKGDPWLALDNPAVFDGQQHIQLIEALTPLGGPAVKQVEVSINGAIFQWGPPEVQALARSLGGQVTSLQLGHCILLPDYWVALNECFPALTSLHLLQSVTCSASDVAIFCSTRAADHPFTLYLRGNVYDAIHGQQVQASLLARGMAHVRVVRVAQV
jgi:hypothetical protein